MPSKEKELKQALADEAYWNAIFKPIGCILVGWTYRNHCQIRLPSGDYLSISKRELELIECVKRANEHATL